MQFEKKRPSIANVMPVKFTVPEVEWLLHEASIAASAAEYTNQKEAHLELLRKVMQARRDAVGDQLPERLAALPLISQDMPPGRHSLEGAAEWGHAMGELQAIDEFPLNPDQPAPHTVAVEITRPELDMIIDMAGFAIRMSNEPQEFEPVFTEGEMQAFGTEPGTPTPVQHQTMELGDELERADIARSMLHAMTEYWERDWQ